MYVQFIPNLYVVEKLDYGLGANPYLIWSHVFY